MSSIVTLTLWSSFNERDESFAKEIGREKKRLRGWSGELLAQKLQIKCLCKAAVSNPSLNFSFHSVLLLHIWISSAFFAALRLQLLFFLPSGVEEGKMMYVTLENLLVWDTGATSSSQALPNRHLKWPQGANGNVSLKLGFSRSLAVNALMFLFDGLLCCIMGWWGWRHGLKRNALGQL